MRFTFGRPANSRAYSFHRERIHFPANPIMSLSDAIPRSELLYAGRAASANQCYALSAPCND